MLRPGTDRRYRRNIDKLISKLVLEQAATLPHNVCNFCDQNLEIESFLVTRNIIGHHIRQTFHHFTIIFGANVCMSKNICDPVGASTKLLENIDEEALRKMVEHNRKRAALCIDTLYGHFEQLL